MKLNVPYKIIRSNRKTASFEVRSGEVIIRVPTYLSDQQIAILASQKMKWIQNQLLISKPSPIKKYEEGEIFKYLGNDYRLYLVEKLTVNNLGFQAKISNRSPLQFVNDFYLLNSKKSEGKKYLEAWYRKRAKEHFLVRIEQISKLMGVKCTKLKITSSMTRWGSCSTRGSVNFNWRLVMAPEAIIDYVIIHELAHMFEPNHSPCFWQKVEEYDGQYRTKREWLKQNGSQLVI